MSLLDNTEVLKACEAQCRQHSEEEQRKNYTKQCFIQCAIRDTEDPLRKVARIMTDELEYLSLPVGVSDLYRYRVNKTDGNAELGFAVKAWAMPFDPEVCHGYDTVHVALPHAIHSRIPFCELVPGCDSDTVVSVTILPLETKREIESEPDDCNNPDTVEYHSASASTTKSGSNTPELGALQDAFALICTADQVLADAFSDLQECLWTDFDSIPESVVGASPSLGECIMELEKQYGKGAVSVMDDTNNVVLCVPDRSSKDPVPKMAYYSRGGSVFRDFEKAAGAAYRTVWALRRCNATGSLDGNDVERVKISDVLLYRVVKQTATLWTTKEELACALDLLFAITEKTNDTLSHMVSTKMGSSEEDAKS